MQKVKKRGIKYNYFFSLVYQVFSLLTPLITAPYVSRVLGSDGVGQYSFVSSIVSYFILFGNLGFTYHSLREIAALQDNRKEQSKVFWEIFYARAICVIVVLGIFVLSLATGIYGRYTLLMIIMSIQIIAVVFDISFLFQGNDIFDLIAIRNVIVKIIAILSIFIFVKDSSDLWIYVLSQCLIHLVSNLVLWTKLPAVVDRVTFKQLSVFRHFKPSFALFIPQIAISIYNVLDRTLIGVLVKGERMVENSSGVLSLKIAADVENGYYEQSQKIITMAMTVFTALSTILVARNANELATGNTEKLKKNLYGAMDYLIFIGAPICMGLAAIAKNFSPWFFGKGYEKTPVLIMIFAPMVIIVGLSNILGRQYLNPAKRDKEFTLAIFVGAGTNLVLNLVLITRYESYGAAVASVIAETMVTLTMAIMVRKELDVIGRIKKSWKIWASSICMFTVVFTIQTMMQPGIVNTIILIMIGAALYFVVLALLREEYLIKVKDSLINRFHRKRN